ncbi:head-tail adaptor protein [Neorhizobium sp. NCHU2750]|uniref:head-tail adaptor protein n=1 Tax=Neorhizobium sp. NCHU2750 TaxID=1825976 RepID=UPI000E735C74|nr:phage head-tail adaptor [Neorhizobium sp. NCHU2750]
MINAAKLNRRVAFDAPLSGDDGHGGQLLGFAPDEAATRLWANIRYLRGGETVQAARLEGRQPVVVTLRDAAASRAIDASWRMRDESGTIYNIQSGPVPTDDRRFLEFTMESGVAT